MMRNDTGGMVSMLFALLVLIGVLLLTILIILPAAVIGAMLAIGAIGAFFAIQLRRFELLLLFVLIFIAGVLLLVA
jgi:hypothetical protein